MKYLISVLSILLLFACTKKDDEVVPKDKDPQEDPTGQDTTRTDTTPDDVPLAYHTDWSYNLGMYEVNIRQYTTDGTFDAFATHLPRLKEMGVGILWLMPIHPIGQENRLGSLGSYYSVSDFEDVNPEFGDLNDFKELVEAIHDQGMYVIIDWVANHTAWDNWLTTTHPEYYVTDATGNFIPPPGTNWSDVIELNYNNDDLREYMIDAMKFWITETGIDGFRCDAVEFVPTSFWKQATDSLIGIKPDILMLAEGDAKKYHTNGFNISYAWAWHGFDNGVIKGIYDGTKSMSDLINFLNQEKSSYKEKYRLYFTSNHDENSWIGTAFEQFGDATETFTSLSQILFGMPLIYSGQEAGLNKRLAFFDKDEIEWKDHEFTGLYTKLLQLKKENEALWNGEFGAFPKRVSTTADDKVFAFIRTKNDDRVFAVFNLSDQATSFDLGSADANGIYKDIFTNEEVSIEVNSSFELDAWAYRIFQITN